MKLKKNKKSERKTLRDKIGMIHRDALQNERGNRCEICGQASDDLARFHILTVAAHPRLEFVDQNILLYTRSHWHCCHEPYHRDRDGKLGQFIMKRIVELRGENYKQDLIEAERGQDQHDKLYLTCLLKWMKDRLARLRGEL